MKQAKFSIGQLVDHLRFEYRGVIGDVDSVFQLSEEWYDEVARSRPPKDEPWYHVLVHGTNQVTYVAERNLDESADAVPIQHPQIAEYFEDFKDGAYIPSHSLS